MLLASGRRWLVAYWADLACAGAIWLTLVLTAQRWAGLDTPDSSFYASLGIFGSEVSDRAYDNSYFWTRLGQIAPTHALTTVFGIWPGMALWHWFLLAIFVAGAYVAVRKFTSTLTATVLTAAISLSTVPLSYLANPYVTGAVLAGTSALIAAAMFDSRRSAILAGALMGWLVMVNPPGVLLAGVVWLVIRIQRRAVRMRDLLFTAIATLVTFVFFLGIGKVLYPELNWFSAYLDAQGIKLSDFASKEPIWLQDISMLVPFAIVILTFAIWLMRRQSPAAQLGFAISASSAAFMFVFSPLMGGIALEAPLYQAMLWPPALIALALGIAAVTTPAASQEPARWSISAMVLAGISVAAIFAVGHWPGAIGLHKGQLLAVLLVAAAIALIALSPQRFAVHSAVLALAIVLIGGQILQNSRPSLGLYYLSPYSWAFNDNSIADKMHNAVHAQEWVLASTSRDDTILTWVDGDWVNGDRELYVVAGMQLWGPNRIGLFAELNADDLARLNSIRPSVIAMYGNSMDGISTFMRGIPTDAQASSPTCSQFSWPVEQIAYFNVCLTRLNWTQA
ncbi:MAG: hypothetical protein Q8L05_12270 [Actinomycetota bacterium]|nr:hypothetical protein [Actinomycetota bacterium]MDP2287481.1 hypothetical protein [Actinomycetota bacterium]